MTRPAFERFYTKNGNVFRFRAGFMGCGIFEIYCTVEESEKFCGVKYVTYQRARETPRGIVWEERESLKRVDDMYGLPTDAVVWCQVGEALKLFMRYLETRIKEKTK